MPTNTRDQPFEHKIKPTNVDRLAPKWVATTTGDVSATPAVVDGAVYFGDFGGTVWKLDAETGAAIWSHLRSGLHRHRRRLRANEPVARRRHARRRRHQGPESGGLNGPNMLGIDATTGALRWATQIHPDRRAVMTGSPVLVDDTDHHRRLGEQRRRADVDLPRRDRRARRADRRDPLADLLDAGQRRRCPTGYAGATMFAPPVGRRAARPRLRHVRPGVQEAGERRRVQRGGAGRVQRVVRAAGRVLEVDRRVRPEDRRAGAGRTACSGTSRGSARAGQPRDRDLVRRRGRRREVGSRRLGRRTSSS